jgi:hypothetical protein
LINSKNPDWKDLFNELVWSKRDCFVPRNGGVLAMTRKRKRRDLCNDTGMKSKKNNSQKRNGVRKPRGATNPQSLSFDYYTYII